MAEVFEVEHIAGEAALLGYRHQIGDQGVLGRRIGQQIAGQGPVGNAVMAIVHHGQDRRRRGGAGDQGLGFGIARHRNPAQRPIQQHPLGRDHVEVVDMALERNAGAFVPAHIEAHRQRPLSASGRHLLRPWNAFPLGRPFEPMGGLHVQGLEHLGVLEGQVGQARGEGERGEKSGHDQGRQGDQQAHPQIGALGPASGRIVEHEVGHGRAGGSLRRAGFAGSGVCAGNMTQGWRDAKVSSPRRCPPTLPDANRPAVGRLSTMWNGATLL